jgi:hypothetical protein
MVPRSEAVSAWALLVGGVAPAATGANGGTSTFATRSPAPD